jgi:hypothetical protein
MKYLFLILFSVALFLEFNAQSPKAELYPEIDASDEHYDQFVFHRDNHLYSVGQESSKSKTKEFYVTRYNVNDFKKLDQWSFPGFEYRKNSSMLWKSFGNDAGTHLMFLSYDKGSDQKYLLHRLVDMEGNLGPVQMVAQMSSNKKSSRDFIVKFSQDSSAILVYNDVDSKVRGQLPIVTVFDQEFNELWSKRISSPFKDGQVFKPISIKIGNDGKLFVLGYRGKRKDPKNKGKQTDLYGVISYYDDQVQTHDLQALGKTIHTMGMQPDVKGDLAVVGLFAEEGEKQVSGGLYVLLDQENLTELNVRIEPFSEEFLENFDFNKYRGLATAKGFFTGVAASEMSGFEAFNYDDFVINEDGSFTVIASRYYEKIVNQDGAIYHYYHYEDLMLMHFKSDGVLDWINLIPRKQQLVEYNHFGGYFYHVMDDKMHLIFNDIYSNKERLEEGKDMLAYGAAYSTKLGTVVAIVDLNTGVWDYEVLTIAKDTDKTLAAPEETLSTDKNAAVGVYKNASGKKIRFAKYAF